MTAAARLAAQRDDTVEALTIGDSADALVDELATYGVAAVHQAHHDLLSDYGPEAWGEVVAQAAVTLRPTAIIATGTDRGNEVLAHAAARLDQPMVANCIEFTDGDVFHVTRVRWGGSLLEEAARGREPRSVHRRPPRHRRTAVRFTRRRRNRIRSSPTSIRRWLAAWSPIRVERVAGITLSTAPVVVGGGRGVGSAEGFASLQELADLLGGVVGCSRAVTNNGWRNHTDQVGQTGTRIAPTSTSRAASRGRSSTGSVRWRRRTSSPSTPIPMRTWSPRPATP